MFCRDCKHEKEISEFPKRVREGRVKYSKCTQCNTKASYEKRGGSSTSEEIKKRRRENRTKNYKAYRTKERNVSLLRLYGISLDEWNNKFELQENCCAICHSVDHNGRGWCTDHDHDTEKVRDILCNPCNSLLGYARDNPTILCAAIKYLRDHDKFSDFHASYNKY